MPTPQDTDWDHFWNRDQSQKFRQASWSKQRVLHVLKDYVADGKIALDAGCGSGFFSSFFCAEGMTTISLDYSESALALTGQITEGLSRMIKADLVTDDLKACIDGKVDLIFSDGLFEHFSNKDQDQILANLLGVLSDDGVVVTFVPNRWSPWELIRPFCMPGIQETPFVLSELVDLNQRNHLNVIDCGGVNTIPFKYSPDKILAQTFGMLLYTVAKKNKLCP